VQMNLSRLRVDWFRRVTQAMLLSLVVTALSACGVKEQLRCTFSDPEHDLKSGDAATRAKAANCLRIASPSEAAKHLPTLLPMMSDRTVYWRGKISRSLFSFGNDEEEGELTVAMPASYAVRRATPLAANVEPLIRAFVDSANQIGTDQSTEGLWGDARTVYRELIRLMQSEYRAAGLQSQIETALERDLPKIANVVVWNDIERVKELNELTSGQSPVVQSNLQRLNAAIAARAAEAAKSPYLRPLVAENLSKGKYSVQVPFETERQPARGMTWSRSVLPDVGGWTQVGCHGAIKDGMSAPHEGSCNPYRGDTVCSAALPLLCVAPNAVKTRHVEAPSASQVATLDYKAIDARIAVTKPVVGASLESQAAGDAVCASTHGEDWRMAQFHDAGGWGLAAHADAKAAFPATRYWVAINDQSANCWNR
jgi:hypothetical protein